MRYSHFINAELKKLLSLKKDMDRGRTVMGFSDMEKLLYSITISIKDSTDRFINQMKSIMFLSIIDDDAKNMFLESSQLFEFLAKTEIKDVSALKDSVYDFGTRVANDDFEDIAKLSGFVGWKESKKVEFIVHVPEKERSLFIFATSGFGIHTVIITDGHLMAILKITDKVEISGRCYIDGIGGGNDEYTEYELKNFCVNLFMYMKCFPDCIKDAPPDVTCNYKKSKQRSFVLGAHEDVVDRSGVTPHFRSGYFKTLSSAFYKKKRGQVVFVHSTFVKGKAVTVLDDGVDEILVNP